MSIWNSKLIDTSLSTKLTLEEGNTPIEELEVDSVKTLLKREDKNPNGSFKDRSLAYQLSKHISDGKRVSVLVAQAMLLSQHLHIQNLVIYH